MIKINIIRKLDRSFTQNILIKNKNNYEPAIIDFNLLVRKNNIYENLAKKKQYH